MARAKAERVGTARGRLAKGRQAGTGITRGGTGASWTVSTDLAPSFDAGDLAEHISDVVLAEHYHAIIEGRRAESFTKQPPLADWGEAGKEAAAGKRPNIRGVTGRTAKPFADNIERTAIKLSGRSLKRSRLVAGVRALAGQSFRVNETVESTRAKTTIQPDKIHANFMALEYDKRGNQFFFASGLVAEAVDRALVAFTGVALVGNVKKANKRGIKAAKARTGGKVYGV